MSKIFRRLSRVVTGFMLIALTPAFAQEEKSQLLFWGGSEAVDELEQYIAQFNETHPDIEVTYESQANLREILRTALAAGEGPDIVYGGTGPGAAGVLVNAGLLLPLDEAYAEYGWDDRFSDFTTERASIDGTVYGIGNEIEYIGMFFNERIFDELGLSEPESHDEVLQLCQTLQEAGYTPIALGNQEKWPASHIFSVFSGNLAGKEKLAAAISGEVPWNDPDFVSAIATPFVEMNEAGCFNPSINAISYDDANLLFYSGQAAMTLTGNWMMSDYTNPDVMPDPVGFFFYPSIDGGPIVPPAGVGSAYFISSAVENPEAAFEVLDYLFSEEAAQFWIEDVNVMPPHEQIDVSDYEIPELLKTAITTLQEEQDSMGYNIDVLTPQNFNALMYDGLQQVIGGTKSPEQLADELQQAMEEAKAAGDVSDITE